MNKITVVYHSADFDGIFCREIARKFLPEAELVGWNYGDAKIPFPEGEVYVLDMNPECFSDFEDSPQGQNRLIWIDHHKTAFEKFEVLHKFCKGYRIDGVAACRLAWQWFAEFEMHDPEAESHAMIPGSQFPNKQNFIDRKVQEPLAVRLAGEYDIWDKRDTNAELFQHGLRSRDLDGWWWSGLLFDEATTTIAEIENRLDQGLKCDMLPNGKLKVRGLGERIVENLLKRGEAIQYAQTRQNESVIKDIGFDLEWEGLKFLACNHARYNSLLFTAGLRPDHDACFGFKWTGKKWSVSLYHAPGKEHHDLSQIAVKHGGGGHKGACGFVTDKLPFST